MAVIDADCGFTTCDSVASFWLQTTSIERRTVWPLHGQQAALWRKLQCALWMSRSTVRLSMHRSVPTMQDEDIMPHAFGLDVEDRSCVVAGSLQPLAALTLAEDRLNSSSGSGKAQPQGGSGTAGGGNSSHAGDPLSCDRI